MSVLLWEGRELVAIPFPTNHFPRYVRMMLILGLSNDVWQTSSVSQSQLNLEYNYCAWKPSYSSVKTEQRVCALPFPQHHPNNGSSSPNSSPLVAAIQKVILTHWLFLHYKLALEYRIRLFILVIEITPLIMTVILLIIIIITIHIHVNNTHFYFNRDIYMKKIEDCVCVCAWGGRRVNAITQ